MNYIVVPEGIAADPKGEPLPKPSFVYMQVLDYVTQIAQHSDTVYLAPANNYGGRKYEQELAHEYLAEKKTLSIHYPLIASQKYIDTYANAIYLKDYMNDNISNRPFDLVCAYIHSYRAEYCFKKAGFNIQKVHRIYYRIYDENIVTRLWYYKYKPIHYIYELLSFLRDITVRPKHR
ncbi:MAG: YdcF family protein [Proteobacteria bacterium]|nr:YdcF family protein [Pseudomonadota bacterium]